MWRENPMSSSMEINTILTGLSRFSLTCNHAFGFMCFLRKKTHIQINDDKQNDNYPRAPTSFFNSLARQSQKPETNAWPENNAGTRLSKNHNKIHKVELSFSENRLKMPMTLWEQSDWTLGHILHKANRDPTMVPNNDSATDVWVSITHFMLSKRNVHNSL